MGKNTKRRTKNKNKRKRTFNKKQSGGINWRNPFKNLFGRKTSSYHEPSYHRAPSYSLSSYRRSNPEKSVNQFLNREGIMLALENIMQNDPDILTEYLIFYALDKKEQKKMKKEIQKEGINIDLYENENDDIAQKYRLSLHYLLASGPEKHPLKAYNFCGPGTKVALRIHPDYWPLYPMLMKLAGYNTIGTYPWNKPINHSDFCCSQHDMQYGLRGNTAEDIRNYDRIMLYCLEKSTRDDRIMGRIKKKLIRGTINSKITAEKIKLLRKGSYGHNIRQMNSQDNFSSNQSRFNQRVDNILQNQIESDERLARAIQEMST